MKMNQFIMEYLAFNKREMRGIFVLATILLCLVIANLVIPGETAGEPADIREFEKEILAFEREMDHQDSLELKQKGNHYSSQGRFEGFNQDTNFSRYSSVGHQFIIELNSADTFDLQRLKGIGSAFAKRIIKYRERLGGFSDIDQLMEIYGMDSLRFNGIGKHLSVNRDSIRKIHINTITFKELMKHPYFPFEATKVIMIYRKDKKQIRSMEELKSIRGIHDSLYRKMVPYLRFD